MSPDAVRCLHSFELTHGLIRVSLLLRCDLSVCLPALRRVCPSRSGPQKLNEPN
jgi:hypothetical protein